MTTFSCHALDKPATLLHGTVQYCHTTAPEGFRPMNPSVLLYMGQRPAELDTLPAVQETCRKLPLVNDFGFPDSYFMQLDR